MDAVKPMSAIRSILCLMTMALCTGCQSLTPVHDYCQIAKPIFLSHGEAAKLSDATAREILTHNESGAKICGWK